MSILRKSRITLYKVYRKENHKQDLKNTETCVESNFVVNMYIYYADINMRNVSCKLNNNKKEKYKKKQGCGLCFEILSTNYICIIYLHSCLVTLERSVYYVLIRKSSITLRNAYRK